MHDYDHDIIDITMILYVNEEKVTVAGCSTGSKEFLRRKDDTNAFFALMKPRMPGRNISLYWFTCIYCCLFSAYCGVSYLLYDFIDGN